MNKKDNFHHPAMNNIRTLLPPALATFVTFTGTLGKAEQTDPVKPLPHQIAHPEHPQMPQ